eukprot:m.134878 g.134878  ORF g.134878 m.134878 type:complete len:63 (-) comp29762_c0_seq1:1285-1473(-)
MTKMHNKSGYFPLANILKFSKMKNTTKRGFAVEINIDLYRSTFEFSPSPHNPSPNKLVFGLH